MKKFRATMVFINSLKKLVLAWDPNWVKLTPTEKKSLNKAEKEFESGETFSESDELWK